MNAVLLLIFTLLSLSSLGAIIFGSDPYSASIYIRVLFFVTLFFSFLGVFSILGIYISRLFGSRPSFGVIFRRGFLFAAVSLFIILLETFSVLNAGNASAVFIIVVALELFAIYKTRK